MTGSERHVLVGYDGSPAAEQALELVAQWAGRPLTRVTLVRVVAQTLPKAEADEARHYLAEAGRGLIERCAGCVRDIEAVILYGAPAEKIVQYAQRHGDDLDLVIMATHARSKVQRWVQGNVAERVLHDVRIPLLLACSPVV